MIFPLSFTSRYDYTQVDKVSAHAEKSSHRIIFPRPNAIYGWKKRCMQWKYYAVIIIKISLSNAEYSYWWWFFIFLSRRKHEASIINSYNRWWLLLTASFPDASPAVQKLLKPYTYSLLIPKVRHEAIKIHAIYWKCIREAFKETLSWVVRPEIILNSASHIRWWKAQIHTADEVADVIFCLLRFIMMGYRPAKPGFFCKSSHTERRDADGVNAQSSKKKSILFQVNIFASRWPRSDLNTTEAPRVHWCVLRHTSRAIRWACAPSLIFLKRQ